MATMELYKTIPGYDGKYQATSWGRVYNVDTGRFLPELIQSGFINLSTEKPRLNL